MYDLTVQLESQPHVAEGQVLVVAWRTKGMVLSNVLNPLMLQTPLVLVHESMVQPFQISFIYHGSSTPPMPQFHLLRFAMISFFSNLEPMSLSLSISSSAFDSLPHTALDSSPYCQWPPAQTPVFVPSPHLMSSTPMAMLLFSHPIIVICTLVPVIYNLLRICPLV